MGPRGNEVWAMDFVHDQLATGRKIGLLTVVETFSHFSPAVDPGFGRCGENRVKTLDLPARRSAMRPRSGSTGAPSSSPATSTLWAVRKA
jgi:hypothetical protein